MSTSDTLADAIANGVSVRDGYRYSEIDDALAKLEQWRGAHTAAADIAHELVCMKNRSRRDARKAGAA